MDVNLWAGRRLEQLLLLQAEGFEDVKTLLTISRVGAVEAGKQHVPISAQLFPWPARQGEAETLKETN